MRRTDNQDLDKQLRDAPKKEETREAHCFDEGWSKKRPAMGQCSETRARTIEQPINKVACNGLRITFGQ